MIVRIPRFSARFSAVLCMRAAHGANRLRRFAQVRAASPQLHPCAARLSKTHCTFFGTEQGSGFPNPRHLSHSAKRRNRYNSANSRFSVRFSAVLCMRALARPTAHFSEQSRAAAFQTLATSPTRQNAAIVMIVRIPRFSARFSAVLCMRAAHGANRLRRFAQVRAASPQLPRALRAPKMQQNPPTKSVGGLNVIYDVLRPLRSWILPSKRELQDRASLQR